MYGSHDGDHDILHFHHLIIRYHLFGALTPILLSKFQLLPT